MVEIYREIFEMLHLAKVLHESTFSKQFHDECGRYELDSDMCYELAYNVRCIFFDFAYEDYNEDRDFHTWVFGDPCIDRFCRLCREYEDQYGMTEGENPYRREMERIIRSGFEFPSYDYDFSWYLSREDRGRKRLLLFTGMQFYCDMAVPEGLLEIREGFDALNLRLEKELRGCGNAQAFSAERKEAA